jgi:glycosyltransferase involved in cell wall biosynthesis
MSAKLGLDEQIHYLGYVPDQDMSALYAEAAALLMPTFFGPTNIPVLEAWAFGCPVVTSDIRGVREQADDAAILVDPASAESIADGICRIWTDATLAGHLAELGRKRLSQYTPDDYQGRLMSVLDDARARISSEPAESMSA